MVKCNYIRRMKCQQYSDQSSSWYTIAWMLSTIVAPAYAHLHACLLYICHASDGCSDDKLHLQAIIHAPMNGDSTDNAHSGSMIHIVQQSTPDACYICHRSTAHHGYCSYYQFKMACRRYGDTTRMWCLSLIYHWYLRERYCECHDQHSIEQSGHSKL